MFVLFVMVSEENVCAKINRARHVPRPYVYIPGRAVRGVYFIKNVRYQDIGLQRKRGKKFKFRIVILFLFVFFYGDVRAKITYFLFQSRCLGFA